MRKTGWLGCFLFLTSVSNAQVLDLETCLKMADSANLAIKNARLDVAINEKKIDGYMTTRLPKLAFEGDYKYNAIIPGQVVPAAIFGGPAGQFTTLQFGVPINLSNTVSLSQIVYNPQVNYAIEAINISQKIIEIQQSIAERDAKQQVASTFFNLKALRKQLSFIDGNLTNLEKLITNMRAMNREGLVVNTEVDKLEINKLTLQNQKLSLKATQAQLENLLKILIGMDADATIELASDDLMQVSILSGNNDPQYPELQLIQAQRELNQEEYRGTKMAYLPSVAAYAAYNYNVNINPKDDFRKGIDAAFIGLKLNWTLFDGFEKYHKIKENGLKQAKLENQEELLLSQLNLGKVNAQKQIEVQTASLELAKKQVELSERVLKQTEAQFSNGTNSSNDLIIAQNSLSQSQTAVVASYVSLRQAELEYLKIIGQLK